MLRFAVHRPGSPDASPRSHGMSCRNVSGCVQVRVAGKTARPAPEDALALARSSVNRSARAAALRRECWVYSSMRPEPFPQACARGPPAGGKDLSVQAGLPGYSSSRLPRVPLAERVMLRTFRFSIRIKSNRRARSVLSFSHQSLRAFNLTSLELRDSKFCPGAAARSTLASRKLALKQPKPSLAAGVQSRNLPQFAGGKRCARGDTSIQAHDFTRPWTGDGARDDSECKLLDHLASVAEPFMLRASRGQLPALLHVSRRAPAPGTPPRLLFDGQVPHESCLGAVVFEDHLLSGCGTQPVAAHTNTISRASDVSGKLGRPSLNGRDARLRSA